MISPGRELNLLVISDVHAFDGDPLDEKSVSYFSTRPSHHRYSTTNPFLSIPELMASNGLRVDWILCPGDLADRADPTSQEVAWKALEELRLKVGARRLIGTVGNHDVDSRLTFDEFDTKGALQSLFPIFPGLAEPDCDFFWSRNFVTLEEEDVLLLVLNSSAFHGINSDDDGKRSTKEYEHGRVMTGHQSPHMQPLTVSDSNCSRDCKTMIDPLGHFLPIGITISFRCQK